jgi:FixJ family two-component response regulator
MYNARGSKAMYRFIIADMHAWVHAALSDLILIAYPTARVRTVTLASDLLADYAQYGADLIILSHALPAVGGHDPLLIVRGTNQAVPVIVFAADAAVGATIAQNDSTRFVDNPFEYNQLVALITEMI